MDEPPTTPPTPPERPTAADLGISEVEYERIVRDVQQRYSAPDFVPASWGREVQRETQRGTQRSRVSRRYVVGVLALILVALVLLRDAGAPGSGGEPAFAYLAMNGDQPVTYSSCQVIQVAVYPAGGPPDAEQLVRDAVTRMRAVTGLDIVVVGAFGGHAPNWNFEAAPVTPSDPVVVSWQDADAIADLTDDVAGLGGSYQLSTAGGPRWVAGTIALSRDYYAELSESGDRAEALAVLLHEFGHVLGLDHVDAPGELMYDHNIGRTDFGPGDLEGLRRLGRGPCV
jgi:hypothetical protein